MFTGYMFNPAYLIERMASVQWTMRLAKQPAFFEGKFQLSRATYTGRRNFGFAWRVDNDFARKNERLKK